jgi:hypothetical protein
LPENKKGKSREFGGRKISRLNTGLPPTLEQQGLIQKNRVSVRG